jgi:hypothetical protein
MNAAALGVAACAAAANALDFKSSLMHPHHHHQSATAHYPFNTFNMYHHQHAPSSTVVSPDEAAVSAAVAASSQLNYYSQYNWGVGGVKSGGSGAGKNIGASSLFPWGSNANSPLIGNNSNNYTHQSGYYYG